MHKAFGHVPPFRSDCEEPVVGSPFEVSPTDGLIDQEADAAFGCAEARGEFRVSFGVDFAVVKATYDGMEECGAVLADMDGMPDDIE